MRLDDCVLDVASNCKIWYKFRKAQQRFCHKAFNDDQFASLNQGFIGPPGEFGKPVSTCYY